MFGFFESIIEPTRSAPVTQPPQGLMRFYWHFARQAKSLFLALFAAGLCVAMLDASVPWFIGRLVRALTTTPRDLFLAQQGRFLVAAAVVVLVGRPLAIAVQNLVSNTGIVVNVTNMVRWQSHRHVVRQSWPFFQNDFAGRIASRVMETGPAVRQSAVVRHHGHLGHHDLRRHGPDAARPRSTPVADAADRGSGSRLMR